MCRRAREDVNVENPPAARRRPLLRLTLVLVPALVFLGVVGAATLSRADPPQPGDPAPAFEAPLLDGSGTLALEQLRGRPVVLNFWASWCEPCEDEAPLLADAHDRYGDEIAFVGVNIKDALSDARAFDTRFALEYPDVRDESGKIFRDYGLTGQPETFFIDRSGNIVFHATGPLDSGILSQAISSLSARDA